MNKHLKTALPFLLLIALVISLFGNLMLYQKLTKPIRASIRGTFRTGESPMNETYLLFDNEGNFCKYTQGIGSEKIATLNGGTYQSFDNEYYTFLTDTSEAFFGVRTEKEISFYYPNNSTPEVYTRLSTALVLLDIPGEYPDWCKPSAQHNPEA